MTISKQSTPPEPKPRLRDTVLFVALLLIPLFAIGKPGFRFIRDIARTVVLRTDILFLGRLVQAVLNGLLFLFCAILAYVAHMWIVMKIELWKFNRTQRKMTNNEIQPTK